MDRLTRYRDVIRKELGEYAAWTAGDGVAAELVEDPRHDHSELLAVGWRGGWRVHHTVFHLDIVGGRVWVQRDATDRPIAEALAAGGVSRDDIVLGFVPPDVRPETGSAVG